MLFARQGLLPLFLITLSTTIAAANPQEPKRKRILVFGDSLTAGYGLGKEFAFPALVQKRIDEAGLAYTMVNGGVSGDTSAGGLRRLAWNIRQPVDVFVLELGANDGLRGISPQETARNLKSIIDGVRAKYPEVQIILAGMSLPRNLGINHVADFEKVFSSLAELHKLVLIPFILEGVGGHPELNQADGIHPTKEGHQIIADTLWKYLEPVLRDSKE